VLFNRRDSNAKNCFLPVAEDEIPGDIAAIIDNPSGTTRCEAQNPKRLDSDVRGNVHFSILPYRCRTIECITPPLYRKYE
jgi:hypothetical protein